MDNLPTITLTYQELYDLVAAADKLSPDHVTGDERFYMTDIKILCQRLLDVRAMQNPRNVDELVAMTAEHYASIRNAAEEPSDERREHRLTAADYGLSHRVA